MNEPAIAATWLMPRAMPRRSAGNASVRIAVEFANSIAAADALHEPPDDQPHRTAAAVQRVDGQRDGADVKTTNPAL